MSRRYEPGGAGFVVEWSDAVNVKDPARPSISYWYGPSHGFGTTWGAIDQAAVFTSRPSARRAYESVRPWGRTGVSIVRVADVEAAYVLGLADEVLRPNGLYFESEENER